MRFMRGDYRQNYKFSYAVLTWCFRLLKCYYALLIWHCKVQCRTFAFNYVILNSIVFLYNVLCFSVLDYVLLYCIMLFCIVLCTSVLYYVLLYCIMLFCIGLCSSVLNYGKVNYAYVIAELRTPEACVRSPIAKRIW